MCINKTTLTAKKPNILSDQFHRHRWDHCRLSVQYEDQHGEDLPTSATNIIVRDMKEFFLNTLINA